MLSTCIGVTRLGEPMACETLLGRGLRVVVVRVGVATVSFLVFNTLSLENRGIPEEPLRCIIPIIPYVADKV